MPFSIIPFLLLVVPILEIAVFIVIGQQIGVLMTLALILVTAVIGTILLRSQGFSILTRIRQETDAGRLPGRELGDGAMILIAGVLLLTPGFVTDTIGFLLFVPQIRDRIWQFLRTRIDVVVASAGPQTNGRPPRDKSESVVELDPEEFSERPNPDSPWRGAERD